MAAPANSSGDNSISSPLFQYRDHKPEFPCAGLYLQTVKQLLSGKAYIHRGLEIAAQALSFGW